MATSTKAKTTWVVAPSSKSTGDVGAFMAKLQHPLKAEIETARQIILGIGSGITEEIKWNAPSFRTTESFATVNLRSMDRVQFIFHLGARKRDDLKEMKIADPAGLIKWLAKDRCLVTIGAGKEIAANKSALQAIVRAWIKYV
jgi:hypothetical protein